LPPTISTLTIEYARNQSQTTDNFNQNEQSQKKTATTFSKPTTIDSQATKSGVSTMEQPGH